MLCVAGQNRSRPHLVGIEHGIANPQHLVSTDWLAEHLTDKNVRVFETTVLLGFRDDGGGYIVDSGRPGYESGHIPGAGFLDLQADFSDNDQKLRFMMPSADSFAEAAGRHGISESSQLILYDRAGSMWAARFWWMFQSMGCKGAVVLNGGWDRWISEGRNVTTDAAKYESTAFAPNPDLDRFAALDEIKGFIESDRAGGSCLINALGGEQHSGADGGIRYGRAGHIPGSTNVPSMELNDPDTGLYRPPQDLEELFVQAGADKSKRVITYCGGGIAASNDALVLTLLGYGNVAVYDASMSEYAADLSLPLVVD